MEAQDTHYTVSLLGLLLSLHPPYALPFQLHIDEDIANVCNSAPGP